MTKDINNFAEHVTQWEQSGLSMAAYCKAQGLNYQTFTYHVGRKKKKAAETAATGSFTRIEVPVQNAAGIEYHLPNGGYFVFPAGCSVQMIKALVG
ncbi:MAG TPA: hypothetical protein PLL28_13910 [Chitinophagales bacterium]|nr:hypothetical protein [Chitinophagales bacterium]HNE47454.1 hypothetical protein [Chitinophagales bacterium]HNF70472.1 hypothetical protein [Chitinophagales bacterium]HNO30076.1 hypothetical protein [Chitinophagales bacterium]